MNHRWQMPLTRGALRREAANLEVELQPCQTVGNHALRFTL